MQGLRVRGSCKPNRIAIYWPPLIWPSALCLSRFPDAQPEARGGHSAGSLYCILSPTGLVPKLHRGFRGPLLLGGGFPYHILSPTRLISHSLGVPRAPSAGWWLSLPHLVSNFSGPQLTDLQLVWFPVHTELYNSSIALSITHSIFGMACLIVIKRK